MRGASGPGIDYSAWERVLKAHVSEIGEVDYAAIQKNPGDLNAFVKQLESMSPELHPALFPTKADELAFYINAYNALVTAGVVQKYPIRSVRDLGKQFSFFETEDYVLGGRKISLTTLERKYIQNQRYSEPRIHFAIVCASLSCPKLSREVYRAETLETQLAAGARQFVSERRNVLVETGTVTLSEIFKWYEKDFLWKAPSVLDFIKTNANVDLRSRLDSLGTKPRIKYVDYDWAINDPGSRAKAKSPYERELSQR